MNSARDLQLVPLSQLSPRQLRAYRGQLETERRKALAAANELDGAVRRVTALVRLGEVAAARYSALRSAA